MITPADRSRRKRYPTSDQRGISSRKSPDKYQRQRVAGFLSIDRTDNHRDPRSFHRHDPTATDRRSVWGSRCWFSGDTGKCGWNWLSFRLDTYSWRRIGSDRKYHVRYLVGMDRLVKVSTRRLGRRYIPRRIWWRGDL